MNRLLTIFASLALGAALTAFAACSGGGQDEELTPGSPSGPETPAQPEVPEDPGDILVVYFSATGNTGGVAGYIAQATAGDLFELVPVNAYTSADLNWNDDNSRVVQEHENEELRNTELVSATPENWDEYDTVFLGYPIWWGIAAWPVNRFVEANDFTGKTVIPFCTSSSSGMGQSGSLLADMAGEGTWLAGHRFRSSASESDVRDWLETLGIL